MRCAILLALLLATPAFAQAPIRATPPDGFKFMTGAEIDALVSKPDPGRVYGATFANDHENYFVEFVKRLDHGNAVELHPHWIDQITILSGEGVLNYGGTLTGGETAANGEVRGGTINGASTKKLGPGDFVLIPAGLAHKFDAAPGKTLTYAVFKARS
jgi:mannose-6-phosphate isomerase-like protein (cupin superfamily)